MPFAQDILTRIIDIHVEEPEEPLPGLYKWIQKCKTGPSNDISGVVQGNGVLSCGNFLHEAGITEPPTPIDPNAPRPPDPNTPDAPPPTKGEYLFYTAMYPGQASPQIREVWELVVIPPITLP